MASDSPRWSGETSLSRRTGWVISSQVLSSTSNFAIAIVVARAVGATEFGAFGIALATYFFFSGALRAVIAEPLIVRFSAVPTEDRYSAVTSVANAALGIGIATGAILALVSLQFLGGSVSSCMSVLSVCLPGLALQDAWRYGFFVLGRPRSAAINDGLWIIFQVIFVGSLLAHGPLGAPALLMAWGVAGSCAGACGFLQSRWSRPTLRRFWSWPLEHRDLGGRFLGEFMTSVGTGQLVLFGLGILSGLAAVASIRGALTLLGPITILYTGVTITAIVESGCFRDDARRIRQLVASVSAVLVASTAIWVAVLLSLPQQVGTDILGASWSGARSVLVLMGATYVFNSLIAGPMVGLRARSDAVRSLRARLAVFPFALTMPIVGALLIGAVGFAIGSAASSLVGVGIWWHQYVRSQQSSEPTTNMATG